MLTAAGAGRRQRAKDRTLYSGPYVIQWSVLGGDDVKGRQTAAAVERSTTVSLTLMYVAHCSLWTRRGYGTCDDMKQYSIVQRTSDISAASPSHQPMRYGRETERSDAIPIIRSLSVIPFDASDGLIPQYRQKYQAHHRFYTSCLNWVFLVSYKNPVLLSADWLDTPHRW